MYDRMVSRIEVVCRAASYSAGKQESNDSTIKQTRFQTFKYSHKLNVLTDKQPMDQRRETRCDEYPIQRLESNAQQKIKAVTE